MDINVLICQFAIYHGNVFTQLKLKMDISFQFLKSSSDFYFEFYEVTIDFETGASLGALVSI